MPLDYFVDQNYAGTDYSGQPRLHVEFESCSFQNCHFSEADVSQCHFIDCEFIDCDWSNAKIGKTAFQDVQFKDCKLLGLPFEHCKELGFAIGFTNCQLNHSTFYQMTLSQCSFDHCQLHGVDFGAADLSKVDMVHCDFLDAIFENTNLEKADLTHSINYRIDPELNRLEGAKFSLSQVVSLLDKYQLDIDRSS